MYRENRNQKWCACCCPNEQQCIKLTDEATNENLSYSISTQPLVRYDQEHFIIALLCISTNQSFWLFLVFQTSVRKPDERLCYNLLLTCKKYIQYAE